MASVVDRLQAAKFTITGNDVSKIVGKATTHELGAPKRKHLDYLISSTHEQNVSLPECADMFLARVQDPSWVVSIKAMMSLHHLMNDGNEKFMRYMASKGNSFEFVSEKTGPLSSDMSPFVKKYGHYLSEKCHSYRQATTDFIRVSNTNFLRQASVDKLLAYIPILQRQIDGIVNLELNSGDICTEISRAAFVLLFRDLIALFKIYNEGVINMLETFFEMEKKHARESFDLYKKFIVRMGKVETFLKIAEDAGVDEGNVPDLSKAPSCLVSALENHLASLEKKSTPISSPTDLDRSPALTKASTDTGASFNDAFGTTSPFGDSFEPKNPDLLSDPILVNTGVPQQPQSDLDALTDLWSEPPKPLIHNNSSLLVEQPFNMFNQEPANDLFSRNSTMQQPAFSQPPASSGIDLLSDSIPEQNGSGFAQFSAPEPTDDLLQPAQLNNAQPTPVQNVRSLMQDLDLGLKSAAANFSLDSSNVARGGPAVGPVRPVSSGSTYNPFIRPGYPMMNTMPNMGMQSNVGMQGNMGMTGNMGMQGNAGMQGSMGMPGNMGMNTFQPGMSMQGNMQMNSGMRAMTMNSMSQQQPMMGQNSNLLQFNTMGGGGGGFPSQQQGQNSFDPFG